MSGMFWNRIDSIVAVGRARDRARLMAQQPQLDDETWGTEAHLQFQSAGLWVQSKNRHVVRTTTPLLRYVRNFRFSFFANDKAKTISLLNPATDALLPSFHSIWWYMRGETIQNYSRYVHIWIFKHQIFCFDFENSEAKKKILHIAFLALPPSHSAIAACHVANEMAVTQYVRVKLLPSPIVCLAFMFLVFLFPNWMYKQNRLVLVLRLARSCDTNIVKVKQRRNVVVDLFLFFGIRSFRSSLFALHTIYPCLARLGFAKQVQNSSICWTRRFTLSSCRQRKQMKKLK